MVLRSLFFFVCSFVFFFYLLSMCVCVCVRAQSHQCLTRFQHERARTLALVWTLKWVSLSARKHSSGIFSFQLDQWWLNGDFISNKKILSCDWLTFLLNQHIKFYSFFSAVCCTNFNVPEISVNRSDSSTIVTNEWVSQSNDREKKCVLQSQKEVFHSIDATHKWHTYMVTNAHNMDYQNDKSD